MAFDFDDLEDLDPDSVAEGNCWAQLDAECEERLKAEVFGATLKESPWLPFGADIQDECVRLYCFFGAGKQAQFFFQWVALFRKSFPLIKVVPTEVPGHGSFDSEPAVDDAAVLAERFIAEVLDKLPDAPFALFGFSIGARVVYEIARRRPPVRIYVAGFGGPHMLLVNDAVDLYRNAPPESEVVETIVWAMRNWSNAESAEKFRKMVELDGAAPNLKVFAQAIRADLKIGCSPLLDQDTGGQPLPKELRSRVQVYVGACDTTWPPEVVGNSWDEYVFGVCRSERIVLDGLTHGELVSNTGKPLLESVLKDLHEMLTKALKLNGH